MNLCKVIGQNIRKVRTSKKISQEKLAFKAGIDRSYLSEIENGYKNLSVLMLEQIAVALELDIKDFFEGYTANINSCD